MIATFPELRIGDPLRHKALSVFPLFSESEGGIEYRLGSEALADESATVMEGLDKEVAEAVRKNLENAGADAELQPSHIVMGMHSPHLLSGCFWCREQDDPGE